MVQTDSITKLLQSKKVDMSAVKANKILVGLGLLAEKERPSSKFAGKMKKYHKKNMDKMTEKLGLSKEQQKQVREQKKAHMKEKKRK